ncbi:kinase-like protein [Rickenella mellea]|uniref:Kinase-like protein n=1 Tax=Rickenella mellea TaxID=50990 RepID=A0A4Y7PXL2_9AGAM|nr:kinase-like protein [Rickenella mellea]
MGIEYDRTPNFSTELTSAFNALGDDLDEPEHDIKLKLKILARKVVYILDTCASLERRLSKYSLEARSLKRHARTLVIFLTRHYITYPDDVEMTTKQIHKARLLISSVSKVVKTVDTSFSYVSTLPLASSFYIRQFNVLHQNTVKLLHYFEDWEAGRLLPSAVTEENADLRQAQATPYLTIPLDLTGPLVNEILGELATRGESPLDQDLVMGHSIICAAPEITIQRIWSHDNIVAEFRKIGLPHILIQHDLLEGERANIGNGAHGNVRLSKDEDGKIVAVKSIRPSFKATPVVTRIVREAQIWHDLDHRNILKLRGWASTSSPEGMVTALISPFCKHGDLNRYLRDNRNLSRTSELSLLLGISNGLDYVHNKDITHADLRAVRFYFDSIGPNLKFYRTTS